MKNVINKLIFLMMLLGAQPALAHIGHHTESTQHLFGVEYVLGLVAIIAAVIGVVRK